MHILSSQHSYQLFKKHIRLDVEEFWIAALNSQLKVIDIHLLFRGTVDSCPLHPRDVFRFLCLANASSFVVAHSHPSGDHGPSRQDLKVTKSLVKLADLMQISLQDHVILSSHGYSSLADRGFFRKRGEPIALRSFEDLER